MNVRPSSLAALALLLAACGSRPIETNDGAAGAGGSATAGTTGGAGTGVGGNAGAGGGVAGAGGGVAGAGGSVAGAGGGAAGAGGNAGAAGSGGGSAGAVGVAGRGGSGGAAGSAGSVGTAGSGGRGGAIGVAGRGGSGGVAGTAGSAGRGGASGSGAAGRGGAGGTAAPGPECMTATDCKLVNDCCNCTAIPAGATAPSCGLVCIQSQCDARQLPRGALACVAGRCVAGFACDTSQVTCRMAPPSCPAGEVPSVNDAGTCYTGACAPASQCTTLTDCAACNARTDHMCVIYQTQLGNQFHCVSVPPACGANAFCDCLGPTTCVAPYRACSNLSGPRGISCSCPTC